MSVVQTRRRASSDRRRADLVIKHFMTPSPHSIGQDQKLSKAHALMRAHQLRHLPVLKAGKLVGIVSQRDLYFIETLQGVDPERDLVEDAMTQDAFCVASDAKLAEVTRVLAERKLGSAVVLEGGKVVGIFTTTDAVALLARLLGEKLRPKR